jgi:hypothetical protein
MTSQRLILAIIIACLLCAIPRAHAWWSISAYGGDTHADITKDVLSNLNKEVDPSLNLAADYPDLLRFKAKLMTGSNTESHDVPDGVATEWWWPEDWQIESWFTAGRVYEQKKKVWKQGALSVYTNYDFNSAYERIGYEIHLVQDQSVPAHRLYCFHGKPKTKTDDLEEKANSFHYYAPRSYDRTFQFYLGRGFFIEFNYWLDDKTDDDDKDELKVDTSDEVNKKGELIKDGPTLDWGVANTDWGTYGGGLGVVAPHSTFKIASGRRIC